MRHIRRCNKNPLITVLKFFWLYKQIAKNKIINKLIRKVDPYIKPNTMEKNGIRYKLFLLKTSNT